MIPIAIVGASGLTAESGAMSGSGARGSNYGARALLCWEGDRRRCIGAARDDSLEAGSARRHVRATTARADVRDERGPIRRSARERRRVADDRDDGAAARERDVHAARVGDKADPAATSTAAVAVAVASHGGEEHDVGLNHPARAPTHRRGRSMTAMVTLRARDALEVKGHLCRKVVCFICRTTRKLERTSRP